MVQCPLAVAVKGSVLLYFLLLLRIILLTPCDHLLLKSFCRFNEVGSDLASFVSFYRTVYEESLLGGESKN